ncbi:ladinin-1 isoform X2 [Pezoporus occidentalis]|uniref:ladinin-1 isoform X2 n=1 Tax=Pezoporus occidentalis TaxID=407982 RepID=UPI002F909D86
MSLGRRNWSDLSSLARQRTLEDEEEQQRERRRRHRNLLSSTSTEEEPPSPVKGTSPASSRPQPLVKAVSTEDGEEHKLSVVLKTQEGRRTRSPMAVSGKLRQEKEQQDPGVGASPAETGTQPHTGQESIQAGQRDRDVAKGRGDPPGDRHRLLALERKVVVRARLQDKEGQGVGTPRGEQRKEVQEPQALTELGGCRLREVKILTRQGSRSVEKTSSVATSSLEQQPSRNPPKEAIQLSATPEDPAEKSDTFPTQVTYSSSIRRTSPRTVSFRVISRKQKEESQSPLTRSASMRIPGSSTTIGEKLEKYNSAVQRSEAVKSSLPVQKSLLLPSDGVASKRNFFEASAPGKAEPLAARKDNLKIPGSVTSRINLWISRAQEPAKEEKSKDIRKINSLPTWVKQPGDTSADTKVDRKGLHPLSRGQSRHQGHIAHRADVRNPGYGGWRDCVGHPGPHGLGELAGGDDWRQL